MLDSLRSLGTRGSKLIRLDAFGYATKTPGTPDASSRCLCSHVQCIAAFCQSPFLCDLADTRLVQFMLFPTETDVLFVVV